MSLSRKPLLLGGLALWVALAFLGQSQAQTSGSGARSGARTPVPDAEIDAELTDPQVLHFHEYFAHPPSKKVLTQWAAQILKERYPDLFREIRKALYHKNKVVRAQVESILAPTPVNGDPAELAEKWAQIQLPEPYKSRLGSGPTKPPDHRHGGGGRGGQEKPKEEAGGDNKIGGPVDTPEGGGQERGGVVPPGDAGTTPAKDKLGDEAGKVGAQPPVIPQVPADAQHISLEKFLTAEEKALYLQKAEGLDLGALAADITRFIWDGPFVSSGILEKDQPTQDAVFAMLLGATDVQIRMRKEIAGIFKSVFDAGKGDSLRDKLKPQWGSDAPADQATFEGKVGIIGPYEGGYRSDEWVNGFLIYAARTAAEMLRAQTRDPGETERDVRDPRRGTDPKPANSKSYGWDKMYFYCGYSATGKCVVNGREVTNLFVEDGRVFAILVNTEKLNPQTNGCSTPRDCADLITIVDITDGDKDGVPDDLHGKQFQIGKNATDVIDDREPGKRQYSLKFAPKGNDIEIQFARTHDKFKDKVFKFSLNDLYSMRALHAVNTGDVMEIGGRKFYIVPMGGSRILCPGSTTEYCGAASQGYMPVETAEKVNDPNFHPRKLGVEYLAYTVVRRNGMDELVGNETSIGQIGGKWWWLSYDKDRQIFVPKEGLPPEKPAPPPAPQQTGPVWQTGGPQGTGPGGPGTTPVGPTAPAGGWPSPLTFEGDPFGFWQGEINGALTEVNAGLRIYQNQRQAAHPRDRYRMVYQAGTGWASVKVKFVQDALAAPNSFRLGFLVLGPNDSFLIAGNDQGQSFIAVTGPLALQQGLNECFLQKGMHQAKVHYLPLLGHVLACAQFNESQIAEVAALVGQEFNPDIPTAVVGNKQDGITLQTEGGNKRIWPKGAGSGTGKDTVYNEASDPAKAFERKVGELVPQLVGPTPTKEVALQKGAAVYADSAGKSWRLIVRIELEDKPNAPLVSPPVLVFSADPKAGKPAPPPSLDVQGLKLKTLGLIKDSNPNPTVNHFRPIPKFRDKPGKGAVALWDRSGNTKDEGCLGVVLWWPATLKEEAETACKK